MSKPPIYLDTHGNRRLSAGFVTMDETAIEMLVEKIGRQVMKAAANSPDITPLPGEQKVLIESIKRWFETQEQVQLNRLAMQHRCMKMLRSGSVVAGFGVLLAGALYFLYSFADWVGR